MDTRGSKRCKHRKKTKTSKNNGKPEVFVLPPDLLKKLGISIGNINNPQEVPYDVAQRSESSMNNDINNILTPNCSKNSSDTSILETANLMTKSVLLSPTFVSTNTNMIPGEVEISSKRNDKEDGPIVSEGLHTNLIREENSVYDAIGSVRHSNLHPNNIDPHKTFHEVNQVDLNGDFALIGDNINQEISSTSMDENKLRMADINTMSDENLNKINIVLDAKLSIDNNSNTTSNTITDLDKNMENDTHAQKFCSKISIISEETIPLSKLKELKKSSDTRTFTPIEVNSIISTKRSNEHLANPDSLHSETKIENSKVSINETRDRLQIIAESCNTHLQEDQDTYFIDSNVLNIENLNNKNNSKDTAHHVLLNNVETASRETLERNSLYQMNSEYLSASYTKEDTNCFNEFQSNTSGDQKHIVNVKSGNKWTSKRNNSSNEDSFHSSENNTVKANTSFFIEKKEDTSKDKPLNFVAGNVFHSRIQDEEEEAVVDDNKICVYTDLYCNNQTNNVETPIVNRAQNTILNRSDSGYDNDLNRLDTVTSNSCDLSDGYGATEAEKNVAEKESMKGLNMPCLQNGEDKTMSNDNLTNILNVTKEPSNKVPNNEPDKVKEIAAYLKKFSDSYTNKEEIQKYLKNDNNKKETINSNTNITTSKLWIQGVEKPGGIGIDKEFSGECKVLRTYTRRNHQKQSKPPTITLHESEASNSIDIISVKHELDTDNELIPCKQQEFCLCYDFGRLAYYDYDNSYEHIHFWQRNSTNCRTDLIFAIYSDEPIVNDNESEAEPKQKTEENVETHNVCCWNVFNSELCQEIVSYKQERNKLNNEHSNSNILELSTVAENTSNFIDSETHDRDQQMVKNNHNSDIILEPVDHCMVNAPESKNCSIAKNTQNDEIMHDDSTVINNTAEIADSGNMVKSLESNLKLTTASEPEFQSSDIVEKVLDEAKSSTEENVSLPEEANKEQDDEAQTKVMKNQEKKLLSSIESRSNEKVNRMLLKAVSSTEENVSLTKKANNEQANEAEHNVIKIPKMEKVLPSTVPQSNDKKRRLSVTNTQSNNSNHEPSAKKSIKCGICEALLSQVDWRKHVKNIHHFIAWKAGSSINLEDPDLLRKLNRRLKTLGVLTCSICNFESKSFKKFIVHVEDCIKQKRKTVEKCARKARATATNENVTCGVCQKSVQTAEWIEHIGREHNYLAWSEGEKVLDLKDEDMVWHHLQNIIRANGSLTCYKCGLDRKRVKLYLAHIKTCDGSGHLDDSVMSVDLNSTSNVEDQPDKIVKCGVCEQEVSNRIWIEHIAKEHNYLAWQDGAKPLDLEDEDMVWQHLQNIIRTNGSLTCYKCGLDRKRVKLYLAHIKTCDGSGHLDDSVMSVDLNSTSNVEDQPDKIVKCGVCEREVSNGKWIEHIAKEHNYLAWQDGAKPLDLDDEDMVWQHLQNIIRTNGSLTCYKCGLDRKRVKLYLTHIQTCDGSGHLNDSVMSVDLNSTSNVDDQPDKIVKCGVCEQEVCNSKWIEHIAKEHNYLAWQDGAKPLDLEDEDMVWQHLLNIIRTNGSLTCYKCGLDRKRVKLYLAHIKTCDGSGHLDDSVMSVDLNTIIKIEEQPDKIVKCGVCEQEVSNRKWIEHIAKEHNYLAWQDGTKPLNLDDEEVVWNHLQQFVRSGGLICHKCGLNRKRVKLYLTHIETCDGTGVSMEDYLSSNMSNDLNSTHNTTIIEDTDTSCISEPKKKLVVCGVCKEKVSDKDWNEHIGKEHNYLAWQDGKTPLDFDDKEAVWQHLQHIIRYNEGITCYKCGLHRKRVKLYLCHIKTCNGGESQGDSTNPPEDIWFEVPPIAKETKLVKCAVCGQEVAIADWIQHIGKEHSYLAWIEGTTPLDIEDELEVKQHLNLIAKENNGLICSKCDRNIKYSKTYLQHVKECSGAQADENELNESSCTQLFSTVAVKSELVTCGVCKSQVSGQHWVEHIQKEHQYIAWIEGQTPLDVNDTTLVQKHLYEISKMLGGLKCIKCGVSRKYVKTYLAHIETCEETTGHCITQVFTELSTSIMDRDEVECAICGEKMPPKKWRNHAMENHYNIAWVVGDVPIELNNPYAPESYLKEYVRKFKKLVCKVCGTSRVSYVGFYAHILTCGKTEEETEKFKATCDICNNKYLRIYKSQHMTMHKEKELALERKKLAAQEKEKIKKEEELDVSGPRKAAEKAKSVIEKYKDSVKNNKCFKCGFSSEVTKEFLNHDCVENEWGVATDSDESVKIDQYSEGEESDETDIDSNISDEEQAAQLEHQYPSNTKKKHYPLHIVKRLPCHIKNMNNYMKTSTEEFIEEYLTEGGLFPQWVHCELEAVSENDLAKYTPPLTESCKFRISDTDDWQTIKRFESKKAKEATVLFVGASAQSVAWAPSSPDGAQRQFLGVAAHLAHDVPRLPWDRIHAGPGLIQIWDLANFTSEPQFVLGIAHDYGSVWAIDWCPSGVRDEVFSEETSQMHRLGLLTAACSNGSTYIFSVPYPSTIGEKDKIIYKIKPVAELRFTMNTDRKLYQATAVKWSAQRGHSFVVVGYSDGSTAHFDLNGESPLLRTEEDNITVFYPYYDERSQNSCIEDVDVFPARGAEAGCGVVAAGGAGGAGAGALQSHVAAARVLFPPHWPAALLAGDDCLVNQAVNELEWWGLGRRLGGMRGAAGCAWCGRVVSASHPLLRVMRPHPGFSDLYRQIIGAIQMTSLGSKRKLQNDELTMILEPITYSEAVKKYGVDFRQAFGKDKATQQKFSSLSRDPYPERFPLADVEAMQFCPTYKHHQKLAIAVHAGIVFIITV